MNKKISGAFSVLITPFNSSKEIDEDGFRSNIRFQIENGVDGIVILGTTSESPTLSASEKARLLKIAREETLGKTHLMVGTGTYSTQETIENTRKAKEAGADSVLVVLPYYNKPTQEGLYQHFSTLAEAIDIPQVVYNVQSRTGINLQTSTLKRLVAFSNIVGVKDASGNIMQMMEVITQILPLRPDFSVMSGDDALTYPLMTLGGHGIYSVLSNLYPKEVKDLCDLALKKDFDSALKLHYEFLDLVNHLFIETNPIPVKTAMRLMGRPAGPCRLPLCEMSNENLNKLEKQLFLSRV
jgi:4-hydroxy-tetrahydrodipicolinate synthase